MKHAILCVDDEVDNVEALERLFRKKFTVYKATSGKDALKILAENRVTVIISDQRMPQMTGVELLAKSMASHPDAIRILLTGYTDINSVIDAINSGQIYRYVTKPWDSVDLENAIDKAVERYEIGAELKEKNLALSKALDELRTLDKAKSDFMMLVNHELKTPLTAISSFADLLAETKLDDEQKTFLSRIQTSTGRLQNLIRDVLEYLSAEAQTLKIQKKKVPATRFESFGNAEIEALAKKNNLQLKYNLAPSTLSMDEKLIANVTTRLLHNACKFAPKNSEISIYGEVSPDNHYKISIENSGPGISKDKIENLLKPFTLNEDAFHHSTGNGLGLSICQALLKCHHSALTLSSAKDHIRVSYMLDLD